MSTRMINNQAIKQQIYLKIQEFRSLASTADSATIRNQYRQIKDLVNQLSGKTADERQLFLEAANVVNLFSREDEGRFLQEQPTDMPQKTAALLRLQEWAKRAGDLLQDA